MSLTPSTKDPSFSKKMIVSFVISSCVSPPYFLPSLPHLHGCLSSVQSLSRGRLFVIPWTAACQDSLSITNSQSLLKLLSIKSLMPSNHLILCHHFLFLPSVFSTVTVFSNESVLRIRWPKYWNFSLSISLYNEYSGPISFWSPCSPRDSQESSPTPQFKSINSLVLSFLYSPALISIHDYWRNHIFD